MKKKKPNGNIGEEKVSHVKIKNNPMPIVGSPWLAN